ncbi:hypothetical protein ABH19_06100 [Leptospirillum sp. Group II 'CF-1']|jgi:hypothetical protein|uniref:NHL repeat protein n=2 Tax=Nitrospiraceae TaxID=189779 RepID=J9ZCP9_LEPFM|nr:hypothetical protein LFML04_1410 [Leptospirillum ferriphilum ML-04]AKS23411.1 hypothetical protein ABH19_06100 [Leptospirillum sp. Group II 'CF-1']
MKSRIFHTFSSEDRRQLFSWKMILFGMMILLAGCGQDPPTNSTNLNFPFGIAIYSDSTTSSNSWMAITSYGTHQVLLFPNYTQAGFLGFGGTASPPASLNVSNASLQGPDGLLVYPSASNISTLNGYTPAPIPNCTSNSSSPALLVADGINNAIDIFCGFNPAKPGPPTITISGGNTQLTSPEGMSIDTLDNNGNTLSAPILFVANSGAGGVVAFDLSQIQGTGNQNLSPSGGILPGVAGNICNGLAANNTALNCPAGLYYSNQLRTLFVSDTGNNEVMIYANAYCLGVAYEKPLPSGCSGAVNIQPSARLSGGNTYLSTPDGIVVYQNSLYVADAGAGDILIWDNVDKLLTGVPTGSETPSRKIGGNLVGMNGPYGLAFDPNILTSTPPSGIASGYGTFFLSQISAGQIDGFSPATTFTGNNPPNYQVTITNPGLNGVGNGSSSNGVPTFF